MRPAEQSPAECPPEVVPHLLLLADVLTALGLPGARMHQLVTGFPHPLTALVLPSLRMHQLVALRVPRGGRPEAAPHLFAGNPWSGRARLSGA